MRNRSMAVLLVAGLLGGLAQASAQDPRIGLKAGMLDTAVAARNMELVSNSKRPEAFTNAKNLGDILYANSDMAFKGNTLFMGSFHGFQVYDISDADKPKLKGSHICPGGQGDLSVHGNLLFMSVEMPNGRTDCGTTGDFAAPSDPARFRGV